MPSRAHIEVTGNVGGDPEIRKVTNGEVCNFSIAVNKRVQNEDVTLWFRAVIFYDKLIDVVEKYVKKGDPIQVAGEFVTSEWEDREGKNRTTLEILVRDLVLISTPAGGADDRRGRSDSRGDERGRGGRDDRGRGREDQRNDRGSDRRAGGRDDRGGRDNGRDRGGRDERGRGDRDNDRRESRGTGGTYQPRGPQGDPGLEDEIPF